MRIWGGATNRSGIRRLALSGVLLLAWPAGAAAGTSPSLVRIATALNAGGAAMTTAVSCPAQGACAAGGFYTDATHDHEAFIVSQIGGVWGAPQEVATAYNLGGEASVNSISCPAVNSCVAVGFYTDAAQHHQAFIVEETNGTWGATQSVATTLNVGGDAVATAVSCAAAGSCVVGGRFEDSSLARHAFVVEETSGTWHNAVEIVGGLDAGGGGLVTSVNCAAVGACALAGQYAPRIHQTQAFVMSETNGVWSKPQEVAGALNVGFGATVGDVACPTAGNCAAGGSFETSAHTTQPFVVNETAGRWGTPVALTSHIRGNVNSDITALSCAGVGSCSVAGDYTTSTGATLSFVAAETATSWGPELPVVAELRSPAGTYVPVTGSAVQSLACPAAGYCEIGGQVSTGPTGDQAFVAVEQPAGWGIAQSIAPGQNAGHDATVFSLSCAAPGACVAGGRFTDAASHYQAFVSTGFIAVAPPLRVTLLRGSVPATGAAMLVVTGSGFSAGLTLKVAEPGASVQLVSLAPTRLVVRLRVSVQLPGRHILTIAEPGQPPARVTYVQH
ncbi:MAG: hypothetical protein ACYDEH_06650 [Acidimicrobiales bacterium]